MTGNNQYTLTCLLVLLFIASCLCQSLPSNLQIANDITLSGISSGAAMAIQFHVSHSSIVTGIGAIAGPPYWCAMTNVLVALSSCTISPWLISLDALFTGTSFAYAAGSIDNPSHLKNSKVYLYTGKLDSIVANGVVDKAAQYYQGYQSQVVLVNDINSEHAWITNYHGNPCSYLGTPFINNCGYDAAGIILKYVLGSQVNSRGKMNSTSLRSFSQKPYIYGSPADFSMADNGFIYIPDSCWSNQCSLHVFFHGCKQSYSAVGSAMITYSGLNEWAEANRIVVLYPQTIASPLIPYNPEGCWDWWGYTGTAYATQLGPQISAVWNMVQALKGN